MQAPQKHFSETPPLQVQRLNNSSSLSGRLVHGRSRLPFEDDDEDEHEPMSTARTPTPDWLAGYVTGQRIGRASRGPRMTAQGPQRGPGALGMPGGAGLVLRACGQPSSASRGWPITTSDSLAGY